MSPRVRALLARVDELDDDERVALGQALCQGQGHGPEAVLRRAELLDAEATIVSAARQVMRRRGAAV